MKWSWIDSLINFSIYPNLTLLYIRTVLLIIFCWAGLSSETAAMQPSTYVNMHVSCEQKQILMFSHSRKGGQLFADNYEE